MKFAKIITGFLCVVCAGLGGIGYYAKTKMPDNTKYTVEYVYYIDSDLVTTMPENIGSYEFGDYYCTNKVTGEWNEANWTFTPNLTDNTKCELHFKTKTYEVKVDFVGAKNNDTEYAGISTVKKGESLEFEVTLDEGYSFDSVVCSNNETGSFDVETGKVIIGPFNNGSSCTVNFKISEYEIKIETTNASPGTTTIKAEYKKDAEVEITPSTNYTLDTIECTNDQTAKWSDNKFTITNVTNNTTCTIKFKLQSYKVNVTVTGGSVDAASKTIAYGKSDSFTITADENHTLDGATVDCGSNASGSITNSKLQVSNVTGQATCKVTLNEKEVEPEEGNEE